VRLYVLAAALALAASSFVFLFLDDDAGAILAVAGVMFWVSGIVLIGLLTVALGRRLGIGWRRTNGAGPDEPDS
jgi:hypothetical protein